MRRAYWRLKYDSEVVAKLYQMRERGIAVRAAIRALSFQREPWTGSLVTGELGGWYELVVHGCFVGFERSTDLQDAGEPTLKILYVIEILE